MNLLITGASGFLGGAFLVRLVEIAAIEKIYVLLRPSPNTRGKQRLDELTQRLFAPEYRPSIADKLIPVEGDITQPKLGLSASDWDFLANNVDQILHGAANTDFAAPIEHARHINVEGTRNVLELAEACMKSGTFLRFDYISTAFVAGAKKGTVF
jgi:thioester reductase-like protein